MYFIRLFFIALFVFGVAGHSYARKKERHSYKHKPDIRDFIYQITKEFPNPPSFDVPVSQLCTFDQFQSPQFSHWVEELHAEPNHNRKLWEWCYILQVLSHYGKLIEGQRGIGFGVGKEPLPSIFAKYGCVIVASDQPTEIARTKGWLHPSERPFQLEELHMDNICSRADFFKRVSYEEVDMNFIPKHLKDFDFTWSSCSLEHIGDIDKGIQFVLESLNCLKKGGIAVHTTEFNLSSNSNTLFSGQTVIFRKQDIERLITEIEAQGHTVIPLNLHPGQAPLDLHIDLPPYQGSRHLKLLISGYVSTSIGIIIVKN